MNAQFQVVFLVLSLITGIIGGVLGAYVGMKVGLTKLETWKEIAVTAIKDLQGDVRLLTEDSLIYDIELGDLMSKASMARKRRQRERFHD